MPVRGGPDTWAMRGVPRLEIREGHGDAPWRTPLRDHLLLAGTGRRGQWDSSMIVDDRATDEQRVALDQLNSGEHGGGYWEASCGLPGPARDADRPNRLRGGAVNGEWRRSTSVTSSRRAPSRSPTRSPARSIARGPCSPEAFESNTAEICPHRLRAIERGTAAATAALEHLTRSSTRSSWSDQRRSRPGPSSDRRLRPTPARPRAVVPALVAATDDHSEPRQPAQSAAEIIPLHHTWRRMSTADHARWPIIK